MSYVTWEIIRNEFNGTSWSAVDDTITDYYDPILSIALKDKKDSFSFKVGNGNNTFDNYFKTNDKYTISRVTNSTTVSTSDIKLIGVSRDTPEEATALNNLLRVEGYNYSETIAEAIVFVDFQNKTVPEAIKIALANANDKNKNFTVTWHPDNDTAIASLTYKTISSEKFFNKTLKKILEKYSTKNQTGNESHYWYVDNNNYLVWRPFSSASSSTFDYDTDPVERIKSAKDTSGIKNFYVLKGGYTPAGTQIQTRYINWTSVTKHGTKYKFYISDKNAAEQIVREDLTKSFGTDEPPDKYPIEITAGTSFTTAWESQAETSYTVEGITVNPGSTITINKGSESGNKKAYNALIREEIKKRLVIEIKPISITEQFGKLAVDLTFKAGEKLWGLGDVIACNLPKISDNVKSLRVDEIQLTTTTDMFTLKEDEGSL